MDCGAFFEKRLDNCTTDAFGAACAGLAIMVYVGLALLRFTLPVRSTTFFSNPRCIFA